MNDLEKQLEVRKKQLTEDQKRREAVDAADKAEIARLEAEKAARDKKAADDANELALIARKEAVIKEATALGIVGPWASTGTTPTPEEDKTKSKRGRLGGHNSSPSIVLKFSFGSIIEAGVYALGGAEWNDKNPDNPTYKMPLSLVPPEEANRGVKPEDGFNLPMFTRECGKFVKSTEVVRGPRPEIFISVFEERMELPYQWVCYLMHIYARLPESIRLVERHKQWWIYTPFGLDVLCRRSIAHLGALAVLYRGIINQPQDPNSLPPEELAKQPAQRTVEINKDYSVRLANQAVFSQSGIARAYDKLCLERPKTVEQIAAAAAKAANEKIAIAKAPLARVPTDENPAPNLQRQGLQGQRFV